MQTSLNRIRRGGAGRLTFLVVWLLPLMGFAVAYWILPAPGPDECSGIGFGCSPKGQDAVPFLTVFYLMFVALPVSLAVAVAPPLWRGVRTLVSSRR